MTDDFDDFDEVAHRELFRYEAEPSERFEWMVRSYYPPLDRTIDTDPTDEETARFIARESKDGWKRTLFRRRKASPWQAIDVNERGGLDEWRAQRQEQS